MQHRDPVRDLPHEFHVVLHRQHRHALAGSAPAPSRRSLGFRPATCRRSARPAAAARACRLIAMPISSHCFWPWLRSPASCPAASVQIEKRRAAARSRPAGRPAFEMVLQRDLEILPALQRREDARHLELDADAAPDPLVRLRARVMSSPAVESPARWSARIRPGSGGTACSCRRRSDRSGNGSRPARARNRRRPSPAGRRTAC